MPPGGKALSEDEIKVNEAVEKGVVFLKKHLERPMRPGAATMHGGEENAIGEAALIGLTLLECGVPADDKNLLKLAANIRATKAKLRHTYSLALAVIFLDRLGADEDRALVKTFALRLVAGQTSSGSWSYHCPILSAADEKKLFEYLEQNASVLPTVKTSGKPRGVEKLSTTLKSLPLVQWQRGVVSATRPGAMPGPGGPGFGPPPGPGGFPPPPPGGRPPGGPPGGPPPGGKPGMPPNPPNGGPGGPPGGPGGPPPGGPGMGTGDNSNAQFALLGLWIARRGGIPVQPSLTFVEQMFRNCQCTDGGWEYVGFPKGRGAAPPSTGSMTCAGLLGMAVGRGLQVRMAGDGDKELPKLDPAIKNGFKSLDQHVKPLMEGKPFTGEAGHRYYLYWSLERVGMLYDMNNLAGKEWYPWLSKLIVSEQANDGSWKGPPPDTCFALLVLRRVNIVPDLTKSLLDSKLLLELQNPKPPPPEEAKPIKP